MSRCAHDVHVDAYCADCVAALTDDELRAEYFRRSLDGIVPMREVLKAAGEEELRAECERRWPNASNWAMWRKAEQDRDELKRRAEAAEAELSRPMQCSCYDCAQVFARRESIRLEPRARRPLSALTAESGPGISRLPAPSPEPLAHLDEDLLCEDA